MNELFKHAISLFDNINNAEGPDKAYYSVQYILAIWQICDLGLQDEYEKALRTEARIK